MGLKIALIPVEGNISIEIAALMNAVELAVSVMFDRVTGMLATSGLALFAIAYWLIQYVDRVRLGRKRF